MVQCRVTMTIIHFRIEENNRENTSRIEKRFSRSEKTSHRKQTHHFLRRRCHRFLGLLLFWFICERRFADCRLPHLLFWIEWKMKINEDKETETEKGKWRWNRYRKIVLRIGKIDEKSRKKKTKSKDKNNNKSREKTATEATTAAATTNESEAKQRRSKEIKSKKMPRNVCFQISLTYHLSLWLLTCHVG